MNKVFGNKIKEIRKSQKLTQDEFAKSLGYTSRSSINKIEKGEKNMSYDKLILLMQKYFVNINDLYNEKVIELEKINALVKENNNPNPNKVYPIEGYKNEIYVKPTLTNPHIQVGDFTYIADKEFESHVTHLYEFNEEKLIIGRFCQIAKGVEFIMNGANHQMNSISTYPFFSLDKWETPKPDIKNFPLKGDTIIGNDVWIGQNAVIMPGVHIGDGVIIGCNSVVSKNVDPYTIVAGNPIRLIRKRFDDDLISILEKLKWWDLPIEEIKKIIPLLTESDLKKSKQELLKLIKN